MPTLTPATSGRYPEPKEEALLGELFLLSEARMYVVSVGEPAHPGGRYWRRSRALAQEEEQVVAICARLEA